MDTHLQKIASLCRFCGKPAKTNEFLSYGVKLEDIDSVHPGLVCQSCSRCFLPSEKFRSFPESHSLPFAWEPHSEDENCVCKGLNKDSRGRPPKRKAARIENESDTESGEELEDEKEKASCSIFREMTKSPSSR